MRAFERLACGLILAVTVGCGKSSPTDGGPEPVSVGTIAGYAFTVVSGELFQDAVDGPVRAGSGGATVRLDEDPEGLGMTDPDALHLRTRFQLDDGGAVLVAAFGTAGDLFDAGLSVELSRSGSDIDYDVVLGTSSFSAGVFTPPPADAAAAHWVVTEYYAQDVPGYSTLSGITLWPLDDVTPVFAQDVLKCSPGPAHQSVALAGDRVGFFLRSASILDVQVVDTIIGPCE